MDVKAFTTTYNGISRTLKNKVRFCVDGNISRELEALWDTGATNTCVSKEIAIELGLKQIGVANMGGSTGTAPTALYFADVLLPNNVTVTKVKIAEADIGNQGIDALIGMDIINLGDFSISNYEGKTVFTFRIPSQKTTNFVQQINAQKVIGQKHGKGKRNKK